DAQHLVARRARQTPRFAGVLAAEDALFVAGHERAGTGAVDADGAGVLAVKPGGQALPRGAAVVTDLDAVSVAEVDAGRVGGDVEDLGDVAAGEDFPALAVFADADQAVAGRDVEGRRIAAVVVERGNDGEIESGVAPRVAGLYEEAARGQFRADHVVLGR